MNTLNATELTDDMWEMLEKVLKNDKQNWRGCAESKRLFINGVLTLLKNKKKFSTCLNWSNLEPKYGNPKALQRRFNRWRNNGTWEQLLPVFADCANYCWVAGMGTYEFLLKNGKLIQDINKRCERKLNTSFEDSLNNKKEEYEKEIKGLKTQLANIDKTISEKNNEIYALKKQCDEYLKERNIIAIDKSELLSSCKKMAAKLRVHGYSVIRSGNSYQYVIKSLEPRKDESK